MTVAVVLFSGQSLIDRWFREGEEFEGILAAEVFRTAFLNDNPEYSDLIMIDGATGGTPLFGQTSGFIALDGADFTPGPELLHAYDQIDDALSGQRKLDFVGTVWGQGHSNTGRLGNDWETGNTNSFEDQYKSGLEWVLQALDDYVVSNHASAFNRQSDDPQVFIQHIGRRTRDDGDSVDGLNDIKDIQSEVADANGHYHIASEGYDLEMPDGTHPSPEAFQELAARMAHFISTGEQGPEVTDIRVLNANGKGKVILTFDQSGSIDDADIKLKADAKDLLQVIDSTVLDSGGFAQEKSIGVSSVKVKDGTIIFKLDREIEGSEVTVSYGYAGVLSEAALSERGDGDDVVEPIGIKVSNPAKPDEKLFLPMIAFREDVNVEGSSSDGVDLGELKRGVSAEDDFTGRGYILYSQDSLFDIYAPNYSSYQATNFMAVYHDGDQWNYFNNERSFAFDPNELSNAVLVASVNFNTDRVEMLEGEKGFVHNIQSGYASGTIDVIANWYNGEVNEGEFGIENGILVLQAKHRADTGEFGRGVAAQDNFSGKGYILYTTENLQDVYTGSIHPSQAEHFVAVYKQNGDWYRFNNETAIEFKPNDLANAVLVAKVDYGADEVTMLNGVNTTIGGVQAGYLRGSLEVVVNQWNGEANLGDFDLDGSSLVLYSSDYLLS